MALFTLTVNDLRLCDMKAMYVPSGPISYQALGAMLSACYSPLAATPAFNV